MLKFITLILILIVLQSCISNEDKIKKNQDSPVEKNDTSISWESVPSIRENTVEIDGIEYAYCEKCPKYLITEKNQEYFHAEFNFSVYPGIEINFGKIIRILKQDKSYSNKFNNSPEVNYFLSLKINDELFTDDIYFKFSKGDIILVTPVKNWTHFTNSKIRFAYFSDEIKNTFLNNNLVKIRLYYKESNTYKDIILSAENINYMRTKINIIKKATAENIKLKTKSEQLKGF